MKLSPPLLKAKQPCAGGYRWYLRNRHRSTDYQHLLDALVKDGRLPDALWLLDKFGPTDQILRLQSLDVDAIVFAGTIQVLGCAHADLVIRAGGQVRVAGSVHVGEALVAGGGIEVGGGVQCRTLIGGGDVRVGWSLCSEQDIRCDGRLLVRADVHCGGKLMAGGDVVAGESVSCGSSVHCGQGLRVGGDLRCGDALSAGHGVVAGGSITVADHISTSWGIKTGRDLRCGGAIRSGEGVEAGHLIVAGKGFGVYAGLNIRREDWPTSARVSAVVPPENLFSGHWESL